MFYRFFLHLSTSKSGAYLRPAEKIYVLPFIGLTIAIWWQLLLPTFAEERQVVQLLFVPLKFSDLRVKSLASSIHLYTLQSYATFLPLPVVSSRQPKMQPKNLFYQPPNIHESSLSSLFLPYIQHIGACKTPLKPTGFVIVSGDPEGGTSAEVWSPKSNADSGPSPETCSHPRWMRSARGW